MTSGGEENMRPVNVDPWWCVLGIQDTSTNKLTSDNVQGALRLDFQPIKNEDTSDFYTVYERETMEYGTEYMARHNKDLSTTLVSWALIPTHR